MRTGVTGQELADRGAVRVVVVVEERALHGPPACRNTGEYAD
jgi:hypothetical protein